ncbi:hypothetical protein H8356DRAFT_1362427 [Neocallimastix lanati (nom. inval.)]|nr:hypothetical protein H8356DRAFT_1362427 [Neocallimastix sp. JGI-2020a]
MTIYETLVPMSDAKNHDFLYDYNKKTQNPTKVSSVKSTISKNNEVNSEEETMLTNFAILLHGLHIKPQMLRNHIIQSRNVIE